MVFESTDALAVVRGRRARGPAAAVVVRLPEARRRVLRARRLGPVRAAVHDRAAVQLRRHRRGPRARRRRGPSRQREARDEPRRARPRAEGAQGPGPAAHPRRRQPGPPLHLRRRPRPRASSTAMEHPAALNEDFNLSTAESTTVLELAEMIWRKIKGPDVPLRYVSRRPVRARRADARARRSRRRATCSASRRRRPSTRCSTRSSRGSSRPSRTARSRGSMADSHDESRRILFAHLLSLVAGGLVLLRVNRQQWFFGDEWEFLGGVRRTRPGTTSCSSRTTSTGARRRTWSIACSKRVRDSLVLAVHRPRDPAAPRRRPPRLAGDAPGPDHAVGGDGRRAAAARSRSRLPEPALGVPDRVPRLGRSRPRRDAARQPRGSLAATRLGRHSALVCVRAALVGRVGAPRRRLLPRRAVAAGSQAGGRIRDSCRRSSTSSGLLPIRRRRTSPRRRCGRSPTTCGRSSPRGSARRRMPSSSTRRCSDRSVSLLLVVLPRADRRACQNRGRGGVRVRRRSGRSVRPLGVRAPEPRHRSGDRSHATGTSRSSCWRRRSRWPSTGVLTVVSLPFRAVFVVVFAMLVLHEPAASSQRRVLRGGARTAGPRARFSRLRRSRTIRRRSSCRASSPSRTTRQT